MWGNPQCGDSYTPDDWAISGFPPAVFPEREPTIAFPPDPPVRAVIHEYHWPAAATPSAAAFVIVLKDGQVRRATAIWRTDGMLNFSGVDGRGGRLALGAIDIDATQKLNAEAGLVFPLSIR